MRRVRNHQFLTDESYRDWLTKKKAVHLLSENTKIEDYVTFFFKSDNEGQP